jgi:serine/threonine-protein kinase
MLSRSGFTRTGNAMPITSPDRAGAPLVIRLLGPFEAYLHGLPLRRLHSRKEDWLLALLALRHGGSHSSASGTHDDPDPGLGTPVERAWVAGLLWPDSATSQSFAYLRNTLTDLRRALGPEVHRLRSPTPRTLCLDLSGADVDVFRFDAAVARGDLASLEAAVSVYRGALLEGCTEEWVFREREAREQSYLGALERMAEHALVCGDLAAAERHLRLAAATDPLRESAQRGLMKVLAAGGNCAGAMQVFRELRERLHQEINTSPDPETRALFQQIREDSAAGRLLRTVDRHASREKKSSIAILPFVNATADPENEYLSDGITEDLITALAQVRGLQVPARTSTFQFKGANEDVRRIAARLDVDTVLEGSVRKSGNRLRITAHLVSAADGYTLWAQTYERNEADLFAIQDDLSRTIIEQLKITLTEEQPISGGHSRNVEAYHRYLKGRYFWNKRTEGDLQRAAVYFQQAIDAEPAYALAYSGLADAYNMLGYGCYLSPVEAFPRAKIAAARALELDPGLAEPHASLGYTRMYYDWDFAEAQRDFQRAIYQNPSSVNAHHWYSILLMAIGRPKEARDEIACAQQLDPLSVPIMADRAFELHYDRQNEPAIRQLRAALEMNPQFPLAHFWLGRVFATQGLYEQAFAAFEAGGPSLREWQPMMAARGYAYGVWGRRTEAARILEQFAALAARGRYVTSYGVAVVHAGLNEIEKALLWLGNACEERSHWLVWLRLDPRWDVLRSDPRFQSLLRKVGFET